jgi:glutamate-1-semialdehyde aminotransferase/spore coat polysaccharide biosynthesis protein SpsF (cytidylyltransferase family)
MILGIIQAQMSSTRLIGKALIDIAGRPMLDLVVERLQNAKRVNEVLVATTRNPADNPIAEFCAAKNIHCFRGSEKDVLARLYKAAKPFQPEAVVRVKADCPLLDQAVVDDVVAAWEAGGQDYVTNVLRFTYPDGLGVEVISFDALKLARQEATTAHAKKRVTSYIAESGKFLLKNVASGVDLKGKNYRWQVIHPEDLELVRRIYSHFAPRTVFDWHEVMDLLVAQPELMSLNSHIMRSEGYVRDRFAEAVAEAAPKLNLSRSHEWFERSKKVIPGASQTLAKGYTQYVFGATPLFLEWGDGCWVWDVDDNKYIDYIQGLLPNILGYAHPEVNAYVNAVLSRGHSFSLPHPLEVQLAEKLVEIIPCAEMVRFAKNGNDATSGAIRAARAYTGRERIASCGDHGWQDWATGIPGRSVGVPQAVQEITHSFAYNDLTAIETLFERYPGEFAAVIMEPVGFTPPEEGYLEGVKQLAHKHGAVLIFDELNTGWRFELGGAQKRFGVTPDLATFGKAMGNGFPISTIVGNADIMPIFEEIFFSFTFGGETASIAAALKVIEILENTNALSQMEENGRQLQVGFNYMVRELNMLDRLSCEGYPSWTKIQTKNSNRMNGALELSLFQQEVVKRGILSNGTHNMTSVHDATAIEMTLEAYGGALKTLDLFLNDKNPERFLEGKKIQPAVLNP